MIHGPSNVKIGTANPPTWCHNLKDVNAVQHYFENLKFHNVTVFAGLIEHTYLVMSLHDMCAVHLIMCCMLSVLKPSLPI